MITLAKDELIIANPATGSALEQCADRFRQQWLPRILADNPPAVLSKLLGTNYAWLPEKTKQAAIKKVAALTSDRIEAEFAKQLSAHVKRCQACLTISFQRTLRLPDDGNTYPLPPGLGRFPVRPVERYAARLPGQWASRGGVLMPIYQAEALWLSFDTSYAWALKVGTGMLNAVSGHPWQTGLPRCPQSYLVLPEQPWLDGYCTGDGVISQFVAARLGQGYTAEEQLQSTAQGGLQFEAFPLKPEAYFAKHLQDELPKSCADLLAGFLSEYGSDDRGIRYCLCESAPGPGMGLGAGGKMKQEIYEDPWQPEDWDLSSPARVWIHLCDAATWFHITGTLPPQEPVTAKEYADHGLPWFDYYREDLTALEGSPALAKLKSVFDLAKEKGDQTIPQEETVTPGPVKPLGPHAPAGLITEWDGH